MALLEQGELFDGCKYVGGTGCDSVLIKKSSLGNELQVLIWATVLPSDTDKQAIADTLQNVLKDYENDARLHRTGSSLAGLVVCMEPGSQSRRSCTPQNLQLDPQLPGLQFLSVSPHIHQDPKELHEEMSLACSTILGLDV